ncbi:N-acyl homoserine lactonase family protein [Castellaniella sp. GW247-6E4]|uniref:N-acyl homoserine lactonase family protein n=1 Tax=Castellaniella sp. GW247-6E4 TaxID=3140380 RepID=UPI0033153E7E
MTTPPVYEIYALRFATLASSAKDNFLLRGEVHDGPLALDFFLWAIRNEERVVVFDTGFGHEASTRRNRPLLRHPVEALAALGIDAATVKNVVFSHLHYDHSGNAECFPAATFHVQDSEVQFATGRCMCHRALRGAFDAQNVVDLVRNVYADRVKFHDGDEEPWPGISLHRLGGHTGGLQVMRVHTARGWVVLASDAAHYYRNFLLDNPFPIVLNIADAIEGNRKLLALADSPDHVVPGHDPQVLNLYPRLESDEIGISCLHLPPVGEVQL